MTRPRDPRWTVELESTPIANFRAHSLAAIGNVTEPADRKQAEQVILAVGQMVEAKIIDGYSVTADIAADQDAIEIIIKRGNA